MASVDRALVAPPKLRASLLSHRSCQHFVFPRPAVPSDFVDYTVGSLRPSLDIEGRYPVKQILAVVCDLSGYTKGQLISDRRTAGLVQARQCAYWLTRHHTHLSLPRIGDYLGGKDHTTILYGCRRVERVILDEQIVVSDALHIMARRLLSSAWARKAA